jgi:polyisoprenoid-binding protein YceI
MSTPPTGTWTIDPSHSTVGFTVRHMGFSKVRGGFNRYEGTIVVADDLVSSSAEVTIQAASFDSGDDNRDQHVRGDDFLDVDRFPTLTFIATDAKHVSGDDYLVSGDLTIRDTTRPIELEVTYLGSDTDPMSGGAKAGLEATTEIDREAFGLTWNAALESGGVLVGKQVAVNLEIEVNQVEVSQA